MGEISRRRPAPAPPKAKRFGKRPELVPEPQRNLIAAEAMDVNIKRLSD